MSLESATFISQLVPSNPLSTDKKKQGDDHLRLIKSVLQATFPNADKAIYFPDTIVKSGSYNVLASDGGKTFLCNTASAFTLTLPTLTSGDDSWFIEVVKTTSDVNPVFIAPPTGTINGYSKIRRSIEYVATRVFWTGTAFVATRPNGTPIGSVIEYYGTSLPNGYLWPDGTTFSASDYVELNSIYGGTSKPDKRGRAAFGKDNMGGSDADRLTSAGSGVDGNALGATGGAETVTLVANNVPAHTHPQTAQQPTFTYNTGNRGDPGSSNTVIGIAASGLGNTLTPVADATPGDTAANTTTGAAVNKLPPAIVANFLIVAE